MLVLNQCNANLTFPSSVLFMNETSFSLERIFDQHNIHAWSLDNPQRVQPHAAQQWLSVNMGEHYWWSLNWAMPSTTPTRSYKILHFSRRYCQNYWPLYLSVCHAMWFMLMIQLIIQVVYSITWTVHFQINGLGMVNPSDHDLSICLAWISGCGEKLKINGLKDTHWLWNQLWRKTLCCSCKCPQWQEFLKGLDSQHITVVRHA